MPSPDDSLTCQHVIALLADYLDGTLPVSTAQALRKHLDDCLECVAFLQTYEATRRLTHTIREEDIPPEVQQRLLHFVRRMRPSASPEHCQCGTK